MDNQNNEWNSKMMKDGKINHFSLKSGKGKYI